MTASIPVYLAMVVLRAVRGSSAVPTCQRYRADRSRRQNQPGTAFIPVLAESKTSPAPSCFSVIPRSVRTSVTERLQPDGQRASGKGGFQINRFERF